MGQYNTNNLEQLAVNHVSNELILSLSGVEPWLEVKDKTPIWDGAIYLYLNNNERKDNLFGRIPVQIKGTAVEEFGEEIAYDVDVIDLKAMLNDGGSIYFVVGIKGREYVVYYDLLAPELIKSILNKITDPEQQTKRLHLGRMPLDGNELQPILHQFYVDCHKQKSYSDKRTDSLEDIASRWGNGFTFSVSATGSRDNDIPPSLTLLTKNSVYLYETIKVGQAQIEVPVAGGPVRLAIRNRIDKPVVVDGKTLYDHFYCELSDGKMYLCLGDFIKLPVGTGSKDGVAGKLNITLSPLLRRRIEESRFIVGITKTNEISFGDMVIGLKSDDNYSFVKDIEESLPYWKRLYEACQKLGLNTDLNVQKITKKQERLCDALIDSLLDGKPFPIVERGSSFINLELGNVRMLAMVLQDNEGKIFLFNAFDQGANVFRTDPNGVQQPATIFSYLAENDMMTYDNIPYDKIIPSYEKLIGKNTNLWQMASIDLMAMINTYDKQKDNAPQKKPYGKALLQFAKWIKEKETEAENIPVHQVNIMQVKKRLGKLSEDDKVELKDFADREDSLPIVKASSLLLLDRTEEFKTILKTMDKDLKKAIKTYPIYHYYKKN